MYFHNSRRLNYVIQIWNTKWKATNGVHSFTASARQLIRMDGSDRHQPREITEPPLEGGSERHQPSENGELPLEDGTAELLHSELKLTLEYQVQRLREIDTKAMEILKANLLLVGIVLTGGSVLVQTDLTIAPFLNPFMIAGVLLLLFSTGLAGVTYTSSNLRGGLDSHAIEDALGRSQDAVERRLLRSYAQWIEFNARVTAINDMFVTATVLSVIVAFVYIAAGLVAGIVLLPPLASAGAFVLLSVASLWVCRLVYNMDHLNVVPGDESYRGVMLSKGASRTDGLRALREMLSEPEENEKQ